MKKAYVKPVFMAEEFVATASVASCGYNVSDPNSALQVWHTMHLCTNTSCSHQIGGNQGNLTYDANNWWGYATDTPGARPTSDSTDGLNDAAYLFTDAQTVCDFVWSSKTSNVGIWTGTQGDKTTAISDSNNRTNAFVTLINDFSNFFHIPASQNDQHSPGVGENQNFWS